MFLLACKLNPFEEMSDHIDCSIFTFALSSRYEPNLLAALIWTQAILILFLRQSNPHAKVT